MTNSPHKVKVGYTMLTLFLTVPQFSTAFLAIPVLSKSNVASRFTPLEQYATGSTVAKASILAYKTSDEEDWYDSAYPIPVGRFSFSQQTNNDNTQRTTGKEVAVLTLPRTRVVVSSGYQHQYDECYYPIPVEGTETTTIPSRKMKKPTTQLDRKAITIQLNGFQEFCDYLADDERLTVIKFYAPWCKTCKKLSQNLNKVAIDFGDVIVNRVKVPGIARFAQVEYSPKLEKFITQVLQIKGVPTVQIYYKTQKLWDSTGVTGTKDIVHLIEKWQKLSSEERIQYSTEVDDGVLQNAIDSSFFDDHLDFLEEEW